VKFTDATVLVTGATSGTGEAKALRFGRPGSSVIVSGRDRGRGERVVKAIGQAGGRARFIAADLRDSQDVLRLAGEAERIITEPGYVSHSHQHQAYLARGRYADQLERLDELFGSDRVHVVDSGRFFTEPEPVYDGVLDFLGLRGHGYPVFERHNARPRSPMPDALRATLGEHFLPYDERLARWLGRPPSWR